MVLVSACQPELNELVHAVNNDPSAQNVSALFSFIEGHTGQSMEELLGADWEQLIADGETIQRSIPIDECNAQVTLTLSGTLNATTNCGNLETFVLHLEQQDFSSETIQQGTIQIGPDGSFDEYDVTPRFNVHLEHPKLVWLASGVLPLNRLQSGTIFTSQSVEGVEYTPYLRINGSYTERVARLHNVVIDPVTEEDLHFYAYGMQRPPVGFKHVRRLPSGISGGLTIDDPIRLGTETITGGVHDVINTDYNDMSQNTNQGSLERYHLGIHDSLPWPSISGTSESQEVAWDEFVANVEDYNATRSVNQPVMSVNESTRSVTVSFMERDNAMYIRTWGCFSSAGNEDIKYDNITVNVGGYIYHAYYEITGEPVLVTTIFDSVDESEDFMEGVQERIIREDDDEVHHTHTSYRRLLPAQAGSFSPTIEAAVASEPQLPCSPDGPCQPELNNLIDAVNSSPSEQNASALFAFIQNKTGQSIESLVGASWQQLIEDGETRTKVIPIPECNSVLTLTLGGQANTVINCQHLPVPPPISFGKNDFDMPEITFASDEIFADNLAEYSQSYGRHADLHVHLDDPEFVWLENHTWGGGPDDTLLSAIKFRGHSSRFNVPIRFPPSELLIPPNTVEFHPYWRIRGRWTSKIEESHHHWRNPGTFGSPGSWPDLWRFFTHFPLMGFREVLRVDNVDSGLKETVFSDPVRDIDEPISFGSVDDVTNTLVMLTFPQTLFVNDSELAVSGPRGVSQNPGPSGEFRYTLPQLAIGEPAFRTPAQVGGGTTGRYEWRFIQPPPPVVEPFFQGESEQIINGFGDLVQVGNSQEAWDLFVAAIEEYQDFASVYDPVVELDEENMEVHVSFETDLNALYLPMISCNHNFFLPANKTRERTAVPYQGWTLNYGGWWHLSGWGPGNYRDWSAPYDDSIPYYQDPQGSTTTGPIYTSRGDPHVGTWKQSFFAGWLGDLAARVARDWPEDNSGWVQTNYYKKPLPLLGAFIPIIEAGQCGEPQPVTSACPKDARCITPGPT
jgi:hypothetical protein